VFQFSSKNQLSQNIPKKSPGVHAFIYRVMKQHHVSDQSKICGGKFVKIWSVAVWSQNYFELAFEF
jgi:hypothetical protein